MFEHGNARLINKTSTICKRQVSGTRDETASARIGGSTATGPSNPYQIFGATPPLTNCSKKTQNSFKKVYSNENKRKLHAANLFSSTNRITNESTQSSFPIASPIGTGSRMPFSPVDSNQASRKLQFEAGPDLYNSSRGHPIKKTEVLAPRSLSSLNHQSNN